MKSNRIRSPYYIIEIMSSELVLVLPNFELEFKVTSNASDLGYGAVLEQENDQQDRSTNFSRIVTQLRRKITLHQRVVVPGKAVEEVLDRIHRLI